MKLLICIVQDSDSAILMEDLVENEFRVTKLSSTGGFLRSGNTTLLLGVEDDQVDQVLEIIRKDCKKRKTVTTANSGHIATGVYPSVPIQITIGGATIFQLDIDEMYRL